MRHDTRADDIIKGVWITCFNGLYVSIYLVSAVVGVDGVLQ